MPQAIRTTEQFYAHALAIEREAGARYEEFARWFGDRREEVLAGLCRNLAHMENAHFLELARASAHMTLPPLAAEGHLWLDDASPEAPAREELMAAATPRTLLQIALHAECRAVDFFDWVARTTPDDGVRLLARGMAAEERQHVEWVMKAIEYQSATV